MNTTASSTAAGTCSLELEYLSSQEVASQSSPWWQGVLGVVGFEKTPNIDRARVPVTASMIRSLSRKRSLRSVASCESRSSVVQRFGASPGELSFFG